MKPFGYTRVQTVEHALEAIKSPGARFFAGGTNLLDLLKKGTETSDRIIDITRIEELKGTSRTSGGGLKVGALVSNAELAVCADVRESYPLLCQALLSGATPQLRNAATTAGNLLQRTRCFYFYDPNMPCNKRRNGSGCGARDGDHYIHAIFGWSDACIATHPSDMAIALVAYDATVHVTSQTGERRISIAEFYRLPDGNPERDTVLNRDELITAVELPAAHFGKSVHYLKVRERSSFAFATVSVAAALRIASNVIEDARLVFGGVAHKPWRSSTAEHFLIGKAPNHAAFEAAGEAAIADAKPLPRTAYKVPILKGAVRRALEKAAEAAPTFETWS